MASIKYKTSEGYTSIPMNIIGSRIYLEDYDDGEVIPELVDDNAKLGNGIGTCSTSTGTALEVTLANYKLVKNGIVAVTFEYDVPANATLNINNKGAKAIYNEGSAIEADVIKAGKTVMFAYDGTNYVVTSLGGSGDIVWPEFVTIQLTQSGGSDSDLIGATVVITNDDTSATILSTIWDGSDIAVQVDAGVDYTVTVGSITDYVIRPNTQSYTAEGGLTRVITFIYKGGVVDLGLPSGTLWARGNIVTKSTGYTIGNETDYGAYISWGNVAPHFSSNGTSFIDGYSFSSTIYNSTPGATISGQSTEANTFAPNSGYDAARELLGGTWRMPTAEDFKELANNCTSSWVTRNGVSGMEFVSNINNNKIFMPAVGYADGTSIALSSSYGFYWTSSIAGGNDACLPYFNSSSIAFSNSNKRYFGAAVRPVI